MSSILYSNVPDELVAFIATSSKIAPLQLVVKST